MLRYNRFETNFGYIRFITPYQKLIKYSNNIFIEIILC